MALPAEFQRFPNEESFRENFLIPMLHRLGFSVVVNNHGSREFGRDIIFGEIDNFGHFCIYGLQAKFEDSIGLGKKVEDLLHDVSQAFNNPFTHPHNGEQHRISRFYVVNGGSISDQAKDHFFNGIHNPTERVNTRLLDGKALIALDRLAAYKRGEYIKEQLSGLVTEIRFNGRVLLSLSDQMPKYIKDGAPFPINRCRLQATSAILERTMLIDPELLSNTEQYWQVIRSINDVADSIGTMISMEQFKEVRTHGLVQYAGDMIALGYVIEGQVNRLLMNLEPSIPLTHTLHTVQV